MMSMPTRTSLAFARIFKLPRLVWLAVALLAYLALIVLPETRALALFFLTLGVLHLVPGVVLVRHVVRTPALSPAARAGWGFLLGVCTVGWLITVASVLDWRLDATFWRLYCGLALVMFAVELWGKRSVVLPVLKEPWRPEPLHVVLGLGIAAACVAKLGSVAANLTSPLHDPASHALMAKLIVEAGHIPWFQLPFRVNTFFYPPGFPSLVAAGHWVSGVSLPQLVLFWTNFSSVLTAIAAYVLVSRATSSRGAGLWAFGFLAFLSIMPTEEFFLAGKNASVVSNFVFLGALLAMLRIVRVPTLGSALLLAALMAETFVIHYEKIYFLMVFFLAFTVVLVLKFKEVDWRRLVPVGIVTGGLSIGLVAPWAYRIKWAMDHAKLHGIVLVPADPSPHLGAPLTLAAVQGALKSYWEATSHFTDPSIAWLSLLAPLALVFAPSLEIGVLLVFAVLMPFFHPAIIETFGLSMASLSYDRIAIHFAYLPVCLAAALGLWALWRFAVRLAPGFSTRVARPGLLMLTASLLAYGGYSQHALYRRVTVDPVIDAFDMEAYAWINSHLSDRRPFVFPVQNPDHKHRRYFVGEAALYLPIFTDHDVVCHFLRIETPQIEAEFRNYEAMFAAKEPGLWVSRHWIYTRTDRGYYAPMNQWLETIDAGRVREHYRNERVRILEVLSPIPTRRSQDLLSAR